MEYSIIFSGRVRDGFSVEAVKVNLTRLFRLADSTYVDRFFSGAPVSLKSGLSAEAAQKYRQALLQAGVECEIKPPLEQARVPLALALATEPMAAPETAMPAAPQAAQPAPEVAPAVWWIMRGKEKIGPFTREALRAEAQSLQFGDMIWKAGLKAAVEPSSLSWLGVLPAIGVPVIDNSTVVRPVFVPGDVGNAYDNNPYMSPTAFEAMEEPARIEAAGYLLYAAIAFYALNVFLATGLAPQGDLTGRIAYAVGYSIFAPGIGLLVTRGKAPRKKARAFIIGSVVSLLIILVNLLAIAQQNMAAVNGTMSHDQVVAALKKAAAEASTHLPFMMDKDTRVDSVSSDDTTLIKKMTLLNVRGDAVDTAHFAEVMRPALIKEACGDDRIKTLLKNGVRIEFNYSGSDGHNIGDIYVNPSDCGLAKGS